ncbi:cell division protein FtsQ/DivIB [Rarobacter incanus]|uniref:Cell division protein FtsQ n=1 Tax=Rarobacter incanus TaxID=153494 RepID=A0A542SLJ1_9MICO|nr:FtsQ-type POTRA domain-containing protein [Rarobacter incanus]TQK75499.1 cell division protein FtsQ [Rarobacter incanus]
MKPPARPIAGPGRLVRAAAGSRAANRSGGEAVGAANRAGGAETPEREADESALPEAIDPTPGYIRPATGPRSVVSTGLQARIEERARIQSARRRRRWWWAGAVCAILAAVVWTIFFSPIFALQPNRVTIKGTEQTVDRASVEALVAKRTGTPLPRLNTTALRLAIKDVRGVQDVSIKRVWPRGIAITILAREPVAAVKDSASGGYVLLDAEAVQVGRVAKAPSDLPEISIPVAGDNKVVLESVLVVLAAIPQSLASDITTVRATTQDDITLVLDTKQQVVWGDSTNNVLKTKVLRVLRKDSGAAGVKVFDVSAPTAPITS